MIVCSARLCACMFSQYKNTFLSYSKSRDASDSNVIDLGWKMEHEKIEETINRVKLLYFVFTENFIKAGSLTGIEK